MEQLPFNQGAEAGLLTRLLLDPAQIPLVSDKLTAEDFYVPEYRRAYNAMVRLSQERKSVDIASMGQDGVGLNALLTQMTQGHRAPAEEYAEIVRRDGFRRRLIVALEKLIDKAHREESRQDHHLDHVERGGRITSVPAQCSRDVQGRPGRKDVRHQWALLQYRRAG